jgi:hypothetical protein
VGSAHIRFEDKPTFDELGEVGHDGGDNMQKNARQISPES